MCQRKLIPILLLMVGAFIACRKSNSGPDGNYSLSYGDSIIYPKNTGGDHLVFPVTRMDGQYTAFPEGIELDDKTGEINVSKSETGLRYRITFTPTGGGSSYTTTVLLAGINYLDAFYFLSKNDTLSKVVYNGDAVNQVPQSPGKTVFDIGLGCNNEGIAINTNDGTINLAQTIKNGFFGKYPDNASRKEFELKYKIDDKSKEAQQSVKIKLYYFDTMDDVTDDLIQLLKDREGTILRANGTPSPSDEIISGVAGAMGATGKARPRPPCIFIIGR